MNCCSKCNLRIFDRCYLMVVDRCWHVDCLQCTICGMKLETELTCFVRQGLIYCKRDYYKLFWKQCGRCHKVVSPKELVMKAKNSVFHVKCFNCVICNIPLKPGEYFGLTSNDFLYCKHHYETMYVYDDHSDSKKWCDSNDSLETEIPKTTNDKNNEVVAASIFQTHQLKKLNEYFRSNQNPSPMELRQLTLKTGITKRVLQVWFRNERAKYRELSELNKMVLT